MMMAAVVLALLALPTTLYTIDATEVGIVTRFGRPLDGIREPGLHIKAPWPIDRVVRVDSRLLLFDGEPTEMLTLDRKNVLIDSFVSWRVDDPLRFAQTVKSRERAEARLVDLIASELGAAIGREPMESFINTDPEKVRLEEISAAAAQAVDDLARPSFGIEVVDFAINGFNLPPQNRASVIERMRAERARIATAYRSEGEEESLKIEAAADAERERILAEARAEAEAIRGEGEAEALQLFAAAYRRDPDLDRFLRTIESYESIIDHNTTIVIEADGQLTRALGER